MSKLSTSDVTASNLTKELQTLKAELSGRGRSDRCHLTGIPACGGFAVLLLADESGAFFRVAAPKL